MDHICIVSSRYPTSVDPTALTFVQQLAWTMADQGKRISVVCPLPVNQNRGFAKLPDTSEEYTYQGSKVSLYFPKYITLGQRGIGPLNTAGLTTMLFTAAVKKVISAMPEKPDVLYGHFVTPSGLTVCRLGKEYGLPAFIAYGESSTWSIDHIGRNKVKKEISNVAGIVAVSSKNRDELVDIGVAHRETIEVFPNGYIPSRFSPRDRMESRKRFGIPEDAFVVGFVGHYIERKGITVLKEAVDSVPGVYVMCAGKGALKPEGERVLHTDPFRPDDLVYFYSAADVFVLPTLNEGCCNAIIEAMACGLPIVSSNLPFNDDILDETNSIRIDPNNVEQIAEAICRLKEDEMLRSQLSRGSLEKAKGLTLAARATRILEFMERRI